jgi:tryptophan synthase alpha chain
MSRIADTFVRCRREGRKALIPFITAGDPQPAVTVPLMHAIVAAGADLLELGVPFSDPMAEGPVIQAACERALVHQVSLRQVLEMVKEFRRTNQHTPVILMGYLNPIEVMGYERFAEEAATAGADGVITVDLPPEEGEEFNAALTSRGLDPILLVAPTTSSARLDRICGAARGFVYYVSLKGVTGAASLDTGAVQERVKAIRAVTSLPVGVGFGISNAESAAAVATVADAVVVGSAVVRLVAEHQDDPARMREAVGGFIAELRQAMDAAVAVA